MSDPLRRRALFFTLSHELLAIAREDGYFDDVNPAWLRAFGFSEAEMKLRPIIEFLHLDDRTQMKLHLDQLRAGGPDSFFENRFAGKNGVYRYLAWTVTYLTSEKLFYIFAHDVSQFRPK